LNLNLHFLDFEFAGPVTRVATPSDPTSSDDAWSPGQSQQISKKRQLGNDAEFNFCIGEKGCSKIGI